MKRYSQKLLCIVSLVAFALACSLDSPGAAGDGSEVPPTANQPAPQTNTAPTPANPAQPHTTNKWALWTTGTKLRGANIYQRRVYPELDGDEFMGPGPVGPPYTQQDFDQLAALGANYVNISHPGLFNEDSPYALDPVIQTNLDTLLGMIQQADMFAVISFRTGPGRSEFTFFWDGAGDWFDESYLNDSVWGTQAAQDAWVDMWRYTAQRYQGNPIVAGYDLMVEPNSNEVGSHALNDPLDVWEPDEFHTDYGGTLYDWNQLYPRITTGIREVDSQTPILIGGNGYGGLEWLPYVQPTSDPYTVYTVHQYAPYTYTHQLSNTTGYTYPGLFDLDWDGEDDVFDQNWLDGFLSTADTFAATHSVPVAVNEFGVVRWAPGADNFMADQMALFDQRGFNHALWVWDPAWVPLVVENNEFNFRFGPNPATTANTPNDLQNAISANWSQNSIRPSTVLTNPETIYLPIVPTGEPAAASPTLSSVAFWGYQIQSLSEPGAVAALAASHYDMLVLEPTRTDWSSDDKLFDTQEMVTQLKNSAGSDGQRAKLVIAYIDIGEAEDWRWYWTWSTGWECGTEPRPADWPDYILTCDPDGWGGNYPVAYWDARWKDIIIYGQNQNSDPYGNYTSVIDEVILDGFDGIYLDWVEAYEDPDVIAAAQAAGVDPAAEMVAFIQEMRAYAEARDPDFLIIQQNAAALIGERPDLVNIIDALAQEAVWFDGDATDDWNDPDGYDWVNETDLTDYYLGYLSQYQDAGLPVFVCEYALQHAATAYANASARGFIPYATRRALAELTTTPPPGY